MRVMITGGGTGGHTSPALAVVQELRKRDPQLVVRWVGRGNGLERKVAEANDIAYRGVPVEGWPRKRSVRKLWVALKLAYCIAKCFLYIWTFRPQIVFGVGGYVSLPLGLAARIMGVPVVIHEQNSLLGMANRMLAKKAARILLSYPETSGAYPKENAVITGNPIREEFLAPPGMAEAKEKMGLDPEKPAIFVCGGSQGARSINQAMIEALPDFDPDDMQILWMTGQADCAKTREQAAKHEVRTEIFPFINDMAAACAAADLIVCRSGASTTAEIACLGKASILIPFPHATDNHQEKNARAFEAAGAAELMLDDNITGHALASNIKKLLSQPDVLNTMESAAGKLAKPEASETIAEEIFSLLFKRPQA